MVFYDVWQANPIENPAPKQTQRQYEPSAWSASETQHLSTQQGKAKTASKANPASLKGKQKTMGKASP